MRKSTMKMESQMYEPNREIENSDTECWREDWLWVLGTFGEGGRFLVAIQESCADRKLAHSDRRSGMGKSPDEDGALGAWQQCLKSA